MSEEAAHEIVIIRRGRSDDEPPHHGGVWKIAFADFMTAMMAFFLVMWLISANDKTRATVARYFNPVQLVDSTPQPQGLDDPKAGSPSVMLKGKKPLSDTEKTDPEKTGAAAANDGKVEPQEAKKRRDEAGLFRDPYAVLAELAAKNSMSPEPKEPQAPANGIRGGAGGVGLNNGDAYRDPFEPLALGSDIGLDAVQSGTARTLKTDGRPGNQLGIEASAKAGSSDYKAGSSDYASSAAAAPAGAAQAGAEQGRAEQAQAAALRSKIVAALTRGGRTGADDNLPKLDVRRSAEGLLVTLTDEANFSMFASGSAEPAPKMVALMDKIGRVLKAEKGQITLRGFTDNRPFRSGSYDNWRLSSARADMAHYMLVRGGLDEARIDRIEGYADRSPKNPNDPSAAENRRIEILIRDTPP